MQKETLFFLLESTMDESQCKSVASASISSPVSQSHAPQLAIQPVGSVGKLQWVEEVVGDGLEVGQHEALKGLHYHRGQGDWSIVIKACDPLLFGNGDDGGGFKAGRDHAFSQWGVKDVREHWRQLVRTVP